MKDLWLNGLIVQSELDSDDHLECSIDSHLAILTVNEVNQLIKHLQAVVGEEDVSDANTN